MRKFIKTHFAALLVAMTVPAVGAAAEITEWRVNSLLHPKLFGESARVFADAVDAETSGAFRMEIHDQLIMDVDAFEALKRGLVDAVWGSPGHHYREDPSLILFGGFPFGPDQEVFSQWMHGGGNEILQEIYARHGLRSVYCGALPAETGGWFAEPVTELKDLERLRMRAFGYGARSLAELGATTFALPARDIYPAFQTGIITAAEFAMPSIDVELSLWEVAPILMEPGWQQPATALEILMTEITWLSLSDEKREAIRTACGEVAEWAETDAVALQENARAQFAAQGVQFAAWPSPVLSALEMAWEQVILSDAAANADIGRVWADYRDFLAEERPDAQAD